MTLEGMSAGLYQVTYAGVGLGWTLWRCSDSGLVLKEEPLGFAGFWIWDKKKMGEVKSDVSCWLECLGGLICHLLRLGRLRQE